MSLIEVANGTSALVAGTPSVVYSAVATPGIYIAKVNWGASFSRASGAQLQITLHDRIPDGTNSVEVVYQNMFGKGSDAIAYTPPVPVNSYFDLALYSPNASGNAQWSVMTLGVPTRVANGAVLLTGSDQNLGAAIGPGVYMVKADLGVMADGDEILLHMNDQVISGTGATGWSARYANTQRFPIKHSPPLPVQVTGAGSVKAAQPLGTFRTIGYEILKLA